MIPVSEMPAGRELDALVAEKVLGARVFRSLTELEQVDAAASHKALAHGFPMVTPTPMGPFAPPRPYSTDISAAWEVWLKVAALGKIRLAMYSEPDGTVSVEGYDDEYCGRREEGCGYMSGIQVHLVTAPLAICRAALKAVGVP